MAVMPNFEAEIVRDLHRAEHAVISRLPHSGWFDRREHPYATQAPAALPVNLRTTTTTEDHMSLATDLHAAATRLENLGEETVTKAEAVLANPATKEAFDLLHKLTGLGLDPALIVLAVGGLKAIVQAYEPPAQAAAA